MFFRTPAPAPNGSKKGLTHVTRTLSFRVKRSFRPAFTMTGLAEWAIVEHVTKRLLLSPQTPGTELLEPAALLWQVCGFSISSFGAQEYFSPKQPSVVEGAGKSYQSDELPIDVLFGTYRPTERRIELFHKNIARHAPAFEAEFSQLLKIVRLHEYAHALVHLGTEVQDVPPDLGLVDADGDTDWLAFEVARTKQFEAIDSETSEFLAQALTYAALTKLPQVGPSYGLLDVFDRLEARQPSHYVVPADIKAVIATVDWSLVLNIVRDASRMAEAPPGHTPRQIAEALVRASTGERAFELQSTAAADALKAAIRSVPSLVSRPTQDADESMQLLVDKVKGMRIEVFGREHPPPHFRVSFDNQAACFQIADCKRISGKLDRYLAVIQRWHAAHKPDLISTWNNLRPDNCPVGRYRESQIGAE
jgi:Domain of unknown function (DUF4160)